MLSNRIFQRISVFALWVMALAHADVMAATPAPPPTLCVESSCVSSDTNAGDEPAIKWHPGHYMVGDVNKDLATNLSNLSQLDKESVIEGFVIRIKWGQCETGSTPGNYSACFNYIDAILNEAKTQTYPKRIMIHIQAREFGTSGSGTAALVPAYLRSSTYNGGVAEFNGGVTARNWEPNVMDRYIAMQRALGARYDSDPYVELVYNHAETVIGWNTGAVPSTFTRSGYRTQITRELTAMRQAWPTTQIRVHANYFAGEMEELFATLVGLRIGSGGPDTVPTAAYPGGSPHNPTEADKVYLGVQGGVDYRGVIPYGNENQSPVYAGKEGSYLPKEIYDYAKNVLRQHHMMWVRMWTPTTESRFDRTDMSWSQYQDRVAWTTGILPFLRANPNTYTGPVPTALGAVKTN